MPWLSITFKYHACHSYGMEQQLRPCHLCSKLPNYQVLNKRLVALAYGRALRNHNRIARIYNLGTYTCLFCMNGKHKQDIEPHIHFEGYHAGCVCSCHWGLKP
jgi:hypothetical protein